MRELVNIGRLESFMRGLGASARESGRIYLTGGASAMLIGWQESTIDVDMKMDPERYPAIDPPSFRRALQQTLSGFGQR